MNLLFLNLYSGGLERGAESFTHELVKRLGETHQVTLIKGHCRLQPQHQFSGSLPHQLLKRLFLDDSGRQVLTFSLKQLPHIASSNYDVVFSLNGFWQLLLLKLLQPFKGYKIIVTGHSGPGWDERWNLYLKPTYFVATTKPTLDWARHTCSWIKSILIPYAIDPQTFQVKPAKINLPGPLILCPAALVPYKRLDLAIRAVANLRQGSLLILGKGPLRRSLTILGHRLLGKRFLLTSVSYQAIPSYYQTCSIVTLPSLPQENSPMVFIEALAAGKMVVATNSHRNRWMLGGAGSYVDPQDVNAYSQALKHTLGIKPDTSKPLQKFSWPAVTKKYQKLIREQ